MTAVAELVLPQRERVVHIDSQTPVRKLRLLNQIEWDCSDEAVDRLLHAMRERWGTR